ncbi:MAG: nitrous oxide reductase accessory protein NosL [Gammaproteobacteria bacterium]
MQRRRLLLGIGMGAAGLCAAGAGLWLTRRQTGAVPLPVDDICIVAPTHAYDPASGLAMTAAREVPAQARCPVCGMYPARNRRWAAQVIFQDGDVQFLDSPLSLFQYLQQVSRYTPGRHASDIAAIYVSDQDSGQWLEADQAVFVHGSTLMGPMRSGNLPAFASEAQAQTFINQRGGSILTAARLRQRLPDDLQALTPHVHDRSTPP